MGSPSITDTEPGLLRYKHWIIGHVIMLTDKHWIIGHVSMLTNIGSSDFSPGTVMSVVFVLFLLY